MGVRGQQTRERILQAGSEVLIAKSYNGCGLNEILKAAKVPKGSFYHYFSSKEDFCIALIERSGDEHTRSMRSVLGNRSQTPIQRIRTYFEGGLQCHKINGPQRRCFMAKVALELAQVSEPLRAAIKCAYDSWGAVLAQTIREAQAVGEICPEKDPEDLANALINLWEGATIRMQIDQSTKPLEDMIQMVFQHLLVNNRAPTPVS